MNDFKTLLKLFLKFILLYLFLSLVYTIYLNYYQNTLKTCDPFTELVADQSIKISNKFGLEIDKGKKDPFPYISLLNNLKDGSRLAIVNEGCNAISVFIVFIAFIFAFSTKWYQTILYMLSGIFILHLSNVFRINLLCYIFIAHPEYDKFSHDYLFPAIIYGMVIFLWIVWIQLFVTKKIQEE